MGDTVTIKKKHHKQKKVLITKRPDKCALCPVQSRSHAMHPLYDLGGVNGQPLIGNDGKPVWVHTFCAYSVNTTFRSDLVYGCDEKGNTFECSTSSDEEDDDENQDEQIHHNKKRKFYDFRYFDSTKKLVYTPDVHHFVIATKADGATRACLIDKKDSQQLTCFVCNETSEQSTHISVQVSYHRQHITFALNNHQHFIS